MDEGVRLQKVLSAAGIASRRVSEELISQGRVSVNGSVVREMGVRVHPDRDHIEVDGEAISQANPVYLAFNKPAGVLTTMHDHPAHRPCVGDYFEGYPDRLFHVGRLDKETEGLLLLTNDGELAQRLSHPRHGVQKVYLAQVKGPVAGDLGASLKRGVELEDGLARVDSFKVVGSVANLVTLELGIHEGRNRIVRRLLEASGYPVEKLIRASVASIDIGELKPGRYRSLSDGEVASLRKSVGL